MIYRVPHGQIQPVPSALDDRTNRALHINDLLNIHILNVYFNLISIRLTVDADFLIERGLKISGTLRLTGPEWLGAASAQDAIETKISLISSLIINTICSSLSDYIDHWSGNVDHWSVPRSHEDFTFNKDKPGFRIFKRLTIEISSGVVSVVDAIFLTFCQRSIGYFNVISPWKLLTFASKERCAIRPRALR